MTKRVCWCPCKASLEGMRTDAIWKKRACALRWSREHPGEPLPGRGNAHIIDTRARSGPQVSYRKAVDAAIDLLAEHGFAPVEQAPELVEARMRKALSTRQREQLSQRSNERRAA